MSEKPDLTHRGLMARLALINAAVSLGLLTIAAGGIATYQAGWQASMTERVGQLEKRVTAADNLPVAVARIEVKLSAMQDSIARIDRKLGP